MNIYTIETKVLESLLVVFVGTQEKAHEIVKDVYKVEIDIEYDGYGFLMGFDCEPAQYFIWFKNKDLKSIIHEVNHLVLELFKNYAVDPLKEQEFFCYFNQYITDEICKQLKIKPKEFL